MRKWTVKKLSTALRQALDDLKKVERNKKYVVDMDTWHAPTGYGKCAVCLAGARLVGLGLAPDAEVTPYYGIYDDHTSSLVRAVDELRVKDITAAAMALKIKLNDAQRELADEWSVEWQGLQYTTKQHDAENNRAWWREMRKLQRDLEKVGL